VISTVIEGSGARQGVLDPLGADLTPGPGAYQQLLLNLARDLKSCLAG
jgi:zinc transport system substrate-binding protein